MFSVVIPSYNRAEVIIDTLMCVLNQTYRPIEMIIVDDGSTDGSMAVIKDWVQEHKFKSALFIDQTKSEQQPTGGIDKQVDFHVKCIQQNNGGPSAARNTGFEHCTGRYLQFLDSDDRIPPERFQILVDAFEEQAADFIQTSIEWFDPSTNEAFHTLWARPNENQVDLVLKGTFWANTLRAAMTHELAQKCDPWDTKMKCFEDRKYMETAVMRAQNPIALQPVLGSLARGQGSHVSNQHTTFSGREWRIHSERSLVQETLKRSDISEELLEILASRIYRVGCRSVSSGWYQYGPECAKIADQLDVKLKSNSRIKRIICHLGPIGKGCYDLINWIKKITKRA